MDKIKLKNEFGQEILIDRLFAQKFINRELVNIIYEEPFYLLIKNFNLELNIKNLEHFLYQNEISINRATNLTHEFLKSKNFYGNVSFLSPEGELMFRANSKKAFWYLQRNLVTIEDNNESSPVLKLKFIPGGLGHDKKYYKAELKNHCVCCNETNFLTRHHVVPYAFRKFMPVEYKEHNAHDVLLLCTQCHNEYELKADIKLEEFFNQYKNNELYIKALNNNKKINYILKLQKIYERVKFDNNITAENKNKMKEKLFSNIELINSYGYNISENNFLNFLENFNEKEIKFSFYQLHMENIKTEENLKEFIIDWRKHFIETMKPKFLNQNWSINGPVKKNLETIKKKRKV